MLFLTPLHHHLVSHVVDIWEVAGAEHILLHHRPEYPSKIAQQLLLLFLLPHEGGHLGLEVADDVRVD